MLFWLKNANLNPPSNPVLALFDQGAAYHFFFYLLIPLRTAPKLRNTPVPLEKMLFVVSEEAGVVLLVVVAEVASAAKHTLNAQYNQANTNKILRIVSPCFDFLESISYNNS